MTELMLPFYFMTMMPISFAGFSVSHYYRATAKHTHGIAVEILSVCPSVKRVFCDKTKAPSEKVQL